MSRTSVWFHAVAPVLIAAALSGCAGQSDTIVADDQTLCTYSAAAANPDNYAQCRDRLRNTRLRMSAAGASRIEGYALLLPAPVPPAGVAGRCNGSEAAKNCDPGDLTGSIPGEPKR